MFWATIRLLEPVTLGAGVLAPKGFELPLITELALLTGGFDFETDLTLLTGEAGRDCDPVCCLFTDATEAPTPLARWKRNQLSRYGSNHRSKCLKEQDQLT